jgi:hypothetical protein
VDSPPTVSDTDYTLATPNPWTNGWEFRNIYRVTVSNAAFGASGLGGVTVPFVHNSPSKPATCPTSGTPNLTTTKKEVKDNQVKITIDNSGSGDAILTALSLTWPVATNGVLKQVKFDGDVVYDKPDIAGGTANLTTADLVAEAKKRTIAKNSSDVLTFVFDNKADTNLAHYTAIATFGGTVLTVLP